MFLPVTLMTTSVLLLLFLALSLRVVGGRVAGKISLGTGAAESIRLGDTLDGGSLLVRTRTHANFAEYVPVSLIGLGLLEMHRAAHGLVVGLAIALVLARLAHAVGMTRPAPNPLRFGGTLVQFAILAVLGIYGVMLAL